MAENPNKISQIQIGTVTYDICDAATRTLLPDHEQDDSSYIDLPLNTTTVEPYRSGYPPKIRRWGPIVFLGGSLKLKSNQNAEFNINIATLEPKYYPAFDVDFLRQGSGTSQWLLFIGSVDGQMSISRFHKSGEYIAATTSSWFPFNATYMVNN